MKLQDEHFNFQSEDLDLKVIFEYALKPLEIFLAGGGDEIITMDDGEYLPPKMMEHAPITYTRNKPMFF